MFKKKARLLFIGDSITDVGRNREEQFDLGNGYPHLIAQQLHQTYPTIKLDILNRGISGDKITDLNRRIHTDCLALKPTMLSILVGINDTWHNVNEPDFGTVRERNRFKAEYRQFLRTVTQEGIRKIVLLEPFLLPIPADRASWRVDLDPKIHVIRELALEFKTLYLPLDGLINGLGIQEGFSKYAKDGVHPTKHGHQLIADQWMTKVAPDFFS